MTETTIAAPLAAALAAKGYETMTPVQDAVLADGTEGRDLLVSAQTGSGKTVAFGLAIAPELLAGADRLLFADVPMALVIAPTRELAQQVARELDWLYAETGAQIATCVGGMDYRSEKRALERGAHIVVGTPGRLRDHIERKSLDLSGLRAAVLDEADEMLDLGFREDLEFILQAAPDTRRTLMFSATVPKAIAELAKDFQRDALRIATAGEARQHADIEYRGINVSSRDREHAIFNLLRFYDARTAIVFCKTRIAVNHLLARMGNRGFPVVALSGELSQEERMRALQSLRDGRARVCIATDVAARGIDLPGLDLVIHADLPANSDVLLHRSGRTGRAGQKGVSALIVTPAEFRKAQRLLQGAKVVAEWGKAPSAEEVQAKDDLRLLDDPALTAPVGDDAAMVAMVLERFGAEQAAAAFVRLWRSGRSAPEVLHDAAISTPAPAKERGEFGASVWFRLSVGRSGRAEARWILPKICDAGGITKTEIGAIRVQEAVTFVQIAAGAADRFGAEKTLDADLAMTRIEGEPALDRPERPAPRAAERKTDWAPDRNPDHAPARAETPRPPRADKPAYVPKPPRVVEDDAGPAPEAPRKPYVRRDDAGAKPWAAREGVARKPYVKREGAADAPRKPYAKRDDAGGKPYAPKAYAPRDGDAPRKPYAPRDAAPADAGTADAAKKARWTPEERDARGRPPRSAGYKSHGGPAGEGAPRPARATGFKSHADGGDRPARGFAGKPGGARPAGAGKPYGKPGGKPAFGRKPAAPRTTDARDTSARFVPPKKPKA